ADGSVLPASQPAVMSWICSLAGQVKPPTIKAYLCHVRSMHTDADIPFTVCDSPMVQRLFRGIKRFHGDPDRAPKSPITLPVLLAMLDTLQPGVVAGHDQLYASWCLAFAAFLRSGEFTLKRGKFHRQTCLSRDSVEFLPSLENPDRVILTLPASKTDPFRKGIRITVAAAPGHRSCAVAALKRLFEAQPRSGSAPNFAGHSFRRGAASQAAAGGCADHEIQLLGRWRSDAYKLYIDMDIRRLLHVSKLLHMGHPPTAPLAPPAL
ncbi:hypothetical protein C8J57DRAFT_1096769, partial [Mycena rebaudengoi]